MTDDELFRMEMGDVEPLKQDKRVTLKTAAAVDASAEIRRDAAQAVTQKDTNFLAGEFIEPVEPHGILSFVRPGVQHGVYKNLRLGKYRIDARLDLHRMSVEQARKAVYQFISDCMEYGVRCVLINHGKGEGRKPQPAYLKSCVAHWLPQFDSVLAFHSAQKQQGGSGAVYILLKKGERQRLENREKHAKRR